MKFFIFVCFIVFLIGCENKSKQTVIAKIDNYVITQEEFDEAYKNSSHAVSSPLSRHNFLNNMINQKLILLDAEAHGLDKNKEFLKMIENFWQQSLLTLALKEKNKEGANIDQWVNVLRSKSKIEINQELFQ